VRLTLRTLLAYLDDILEPKQTKEIGEKIADSHFATSLINRIREVLRRRRLTAPALHGPESGLDPNVVAEYLDNTLPPEKVADVEKTCLESDMYLAEMAGSHQILTLVLGEPVDIVPESRERMYALTAPQQSVSLDSAPPAAVAEPPAAKAPAAPQPAPQPAKSKTDDAFADDDEYFRHTIPEYLRKPPLWKRLAPYGIVAAAVLLIAGTMLSTNSSDDQQSAENLDKSKVVAMNDTKPVESLPEQDEPAVEATDTNDEEVISDDEATVVATNEPADEQNAENKSNEFVFEDPGVAFDPPAPDEEQEDSVAMVPPLEGPEEPGSLVNTELFPTTVADETGADLPNLDEVVTTDIADVATESLPEDAVELLPQESNETTPTEVASTDDPADATEQKPVIETPPTTTEEPSKPERVFQPPATAQYQWHGGMNQGQGGVALFRDPDEHGWKKLAPRQMIYPGDRIAVPDPYIASMRLSEGNTHLTLLPGTQNGASIELTDPTDAGHCTIKVYQGRLVFRGNPQAVEGNVQPVEIGLMVHGELWQVKFVSPDAVWGLEVTPRRPQGPASTNSGSDYLASIYVTQGSIRFADRENLEVTREGPSWIPLTPGQRPTTESVASILPLTTIPHWLGQQNLSRKQLENSRRFAREFDDVQPIEISLVGAIDHRDPDISELAVKCFALTDNYKRLAETLARSEHAAARRAAADGLRDWLLLADDNGGKLEEALAGVFHQENAAIINGLLWGISEADARKLGPSEELIKLMGHPEPVIRELAFDQAKLLSGKKGSLGYHPDDPEPKRNKSIQSWLKSVQRSDGLQRQ